VRSVTFMGRYQKTGSVIAVHAPNAGVPSSPATSNSSALPQPLSSCGADEDLVDQDLYGAWYRQNHQTEMRLTWETGTAEGAGSVRNGVV
jgi:hypothetical protein